MTATISEILTNGIIFDLKNWNKKKINDNNLFANVEYLFNILDNQNINYLLVGCLALLTYIEGILNDIQSRIKRFSRQQKNLDN